MHTALSGTYDQQLQRGAFVLKDKTDKEQTSHIDEQWSVVTWLCIDYTCAMGILRQISLEDLVIEFSQKKE